ncbi:hypothetical protein [Streptomyces sp. NPDC013187]
MTTTTPLVERAGAELAALPRWPPAPSDQRNIRPARSVVGLEGGTE